MFLHHFKWGVPYLCAASETGRDVAQQYIETEVGTLPVHKVAGHMSQGPDYEAFPERSNNTNLLYMLEIYVDNYISLAILTSRAQLDHVSTGVM